MTSVVQRGAVMRRDRYSNVVFAVLAALLSQSSKYTSIILITQRLFTYSAAFKYTGIHHNVP
jgi:hypothetical protein